MAMLNLRNDKKDNNKNAVPPMPRVATLPAPPRQSHKEHAEEYARGMQRYLEQVEEINALKSECDEWQRRALMAEAEIKRLELREANLIQQMDLKNQRLLEERDTFKHMITVLVSQFHSANKIIMDAMDAVNKFAPRPPVNLDSLSQELDKHEPDSMPRVVTAGPAHQDDDRLKGGDYPEQAPKQ